MHSLHAYFFSVALGLCVSLVSIAESPSTPQSGTSSNVKIFSDDVFKLQSTEPPPPESKTTAGGNKVYRGEDPNYNSAQRASALKFCQHLQDQPEAHKQCFNEQMAAETGKSNPVGKSAPSRKGSSVKDPYESDGEPSDSED